jgi:hypothetical protein
MSFMPLFPHAALIRKLVYQNIFDVESYADRKFIQIIPRFPKTPRKSLTLAEELESPRCVTSSLWVFWAPADGSFLQSFQLTTAGAETSLSSVKPSL